MKCGWYEVITVQGCNNKRRQWIHYSVALDGCQNGSYSISSPSLLIRFSLAIYTYILYWKLLILFLMTNEMNFAYLPHFITLDMGILLHRRNYVPYQKLAIYDDLAFWYYPA